MKSILKRTTAIAALAALPIASFAADAAAQQNASQTQGAGAAQQIQGDAASGQQGQSGQQASGETQQGQSGQQASGETQQGQSGQQGSGQTQQGQSGQQASGQTQQGQTGERASGEAQQQAGDAAEDALIARVGDTEIRRSHVLDAIAQLPPQLHQQPPEMLIPLAVDQLVTRELILGEAREANLDEDPEVTALAPDNATETARENAMVQVWLDRQLRDRVTDQQVQETYDAVKAQFGAEAPPIDQLRPQIENELRQQAFLEISSDLQSNADITVYGPDGQPLQPSDTATQ